MTPSPQPETPLEVFSEEPLDIFYFYLGLLRNTIKEVNPETWRSLLNQTPPNQKRDPEMTSRPNPESE
tara:strand:+ start:676 stop:879 length:204 start_codon:yes stop_codon:yes gene_type:complete